MPKKTLIPAQAIHKSASMAEQEPSFSTTLDSANSIWTDRRQPYKQAPDDHRSPYEVDYSRVIHSASFRRLQGKMQILASNDGDFHRTRMTHSLEVAQIGRGIVQHLRKTDDRPTVLSMLPDRELIETICLIHDLGHPPFGHGGETSLNYCMRQSGGFEGNGQTLRILSKLEVFSANHGSNLTRRTLLGSLKYPVSYSEVQPVPPQDCVISPINGQPMLSAKHHTPPKCFMDSEQDVVDWIFAPFSPSECAKIKANRAKSFDCSIMDLSDDISYGLGDLEDAIALGFVAVEQLHEDIDESLWDDFIECLEDDYQTDLLGDNGTNYAELTRALFSRDPANTKKMIGRLVRYMLANIYVITRPEYESEMYQLHATLRPQALALLAALKRFIHRRVINSPQVQQIRFKGQNMIIQLFAYLDHDPQHLLPSHVFALYAQESDPHAQRRVICDYVASMTDASLTQAYERLFSPRIGSSFDNL